MGGLWVGGEDGNGGRVVRMVMVGGWVVRMVMMGGRVVMVGGWVDGW